MRHILITKSLPLTDADVKVEVKGRQVVVTGPLGVVKSNFNHCPCKLRIVTTSQGSKLEVRMMNSTTKDAATVRSIITTVQKMITGVKVGYRYKMRLVYAHFPINVKIANDNTNVEIRNFLGEKRVRYCQMIGEETRVMEGELKDELYIEGIDLRDVSQSAARIHTSCLVRKKDIRKFLDGVYVWAKGPKGDEVAL